MQKIRQLVLLLLVLFSLPSCGLLRSLAHSVDPPYREPAEGPRAKLRVLYEGAIVRFYPGDSCLNQDNYDAGAAGPYAGYIRSAKRLGMPLQPKKGQFDEFYVKANEPMAVSFYYRSESLVRPDHKQVVECGPLGFVFTPGDDALYETRFEFTSRRSCGYVIDKVVKDETGTYQRQPLHGVPVSFCPKQKGEGSAPQGGALPSGTGELERRYY